MDNKTRERLIRYWLNSAKRHVRKTDGKTSAFISVRLDAPIEAVWKAWTDQTEISLWFAKVTGDIEEGNEITIDVGAPCTISSKILELRYRKLIHFTWFYPGRVTDEVEVRFSHDGSSTVLELEQYSTDTSNWWYGAGSGWESALLKLSLLLSGNDPRSISNNTFDETFGPLWLAAGDPGPTNEN